MRRTNAAGIGFRKILPALGAIALLAAPAAAQQHEYEPDQGLHEEEWYDPSDWFNGGPGVDYEGERDYESSRPYYDNYFYDPGYSPGYYEPDRYYGFEGPGYDPFPAAPYGNRYGRYGRDREVTGVVLGMERLRGGYGTPEGVRLRVRTDDGQERTMYLGDWRYVRERQPRLRTGDPVKIRGQFIRRDGERYFKAGEIRSRDGEFVIPDYEWNRTVRGELVGMQRVTADDGELEAMVARVRTEDGKTINVALGPVSEWGDDTTIRPRDRVEIDGYVRRMPGGERTFVIQDIEVEGRSARGRGNSE